MTKAEKKARNMIANKSMKQLVEQFELTEALPISIELAFVRGWIMDELEKRDPEAYDRWIDADTDESPRKFFLK